MLIFEHFDYTGREQRWKVPEGVTEATFECWGASGGMPSSLAFEGKKREVRGGSGPRNIYFYNRLNAEGQLGVSYANNAGYAGGTKSVTAGDTYYIFVGGNGQPGHSTIKLQKDGTTYSVGLRGGAGGWNGGGDGGKGAHIKQNLYNSTSTKVHYKRATLPNSAKAGQLWYDTDAHVVKQCNTTYSAGNGTNAKWTQVTHKHAHAVGPSGGGGGGATDIRLGGDDLSNRILVAGGGGGAGGSWNKTGTAAWTLRQVPSSPNPPFGSDDKSNVSSPTGPDHTYATQVNYLVGGWGGGGLGGATGPTPNTAPTTDGGRATSGGSGGPSTARHEDGKAPGAQHGSGGHGGTHVAGGSRGSGGKNGSSGSLGNGGSGADADGGYDDWCAGGGGGGGGYYGGGGGGQGFKVSGHNSSIHTRGGGGGGGSNYVSSVFTSARLHGCARPPVAQSRHSTGSNGHGGFARISYRKPPSAKWKNTPRAVLGGSTFTGTFTYRPAQSDGTGISYYIVGTAADPAATTPTAETTIMVTDSTATEFSHDFTAPAIGSTSAIFVRVVDLDGDASDWLKQQITGLAATVTDTATITAPAAGSQFIDTATVTWTLGTQTPLAAYRLGLTGTDLVTGATHTVTTPWRRGGSRVNLALDPGFKGTSIWSSTSNSALVSDTTYPGVSGSNGKIGWAFTDDNSAEQHTTVWDNLNPGTTYRLHLGVASASGHDKRPVALQVWDDDGILTSTTVDLSANAAGVYTEVDVQFTPHTQGVYVVLIPAAVGVDAETDPLVSLDFEDATTGGFTGSAASSTAQSNSGDYSIKVTGTASLDPSASLTGAGDYMVECWAYAPSGGVGKSTLQVNGTGIADTSYGENPTTNAWVHLRLPFTWDGSGTVSVNVTGDATGVYYDDVQVFPADNTGSPDFGNTDTWQGTFLKDMLLEVVYEEDGAGYGAYFDGTNANGTGLTVSWSGTTNDSPSYGTGTDVVTGTLDYPKAKLNAGSLFLDTLTEAAVLSGYDGSRVSESVVVNPSLPATPTVTLTVDNTTGLMTLAIDAADGSATYKTVSFDIFRNGTRIATGLTPDGTTRQASYIDAPGQGVSTTYVVRAFDAEGGYADQTDGTVTVLG